eukprot:222759-Prymnesium_polylepis.1
MRTALPTTIARALTSRELPLTSVTIVGRFGMALPTAPSFPPARATCAAGDEAAQRCRAATPAVLLNY